MADFILGIFLAALVVRGWVRGFVREIFDLIALVVGLWVAFRLSAPLGDYLTRSFGVAPEVARIGAGIALFILFGASLAVAAHYLSKIANLPGLSMVNRVGGAAIAALWAIALILVLVNVVRVLPVPESWQQELEESTVAAVIAGPGAVPQELFNSLAGDNVMGALATIQDLFGDDRAVPEGDEVLTLPSAASDEIRQVRGEAEDLVSEINSYRAGLGLRALQPSEAIAGLAELKAEQSYVSGTLARGNSPRDALSQLGVRVVQAGEALALAGTALGALDGILDSETGRAELENPAYDRAGISVVEGPTGRLVVVVLAG